ncbi:MAG: translation initiation factor IF-2 subunit alpha [Methanobacteriota archaeon]
MVRHRSEWPSIEEFVMCTVTKVFAQGAFVKIDEYGGKEGMVHLSEVASGWVKNIRDYVRENQKAVCKVLGVDSKRQQVDLSIRRVKDGERRWKTQRVKLNQRSEKILEMAANNLGKTLDQAYEEIGFTLQERFGDLHSAMESAAKDGGSIAGIGDEAWTNAISEVAKASIQSPSYKVSGYVNLSSLAPDGVEVIKSAMINSRDSIRDENTNVELYYMGAPRYRIEVTAPSYKVAENEMQRAVQFMIEAVTKASGKGEFQRAK